MIEEQIVKMIVNMGEIGLLLLGCGVAIKYFTDKEKTNTKKQEEIQKSLMEQIKKNDEQRVLAYKEMFNELREDNKNREEALLETIKALREDAKNREDMYKESLDKFSKAIEVSNDTLLELSMQIENMGSRMGDVEHSMNRINEKLGLPQITKKEVTAN